MNHEKSPEAESATKPHARDRVRAEAWFRAVRRAHSADTLAIVELINEAYRVESFFVEGPRTTAESIRELINHGEMLALYGSSTELFVTAHLHCERASGHLGLISVLPRSQGQGLGRRIIAVAEGLAAAQGCQQMHLQVVNLRPELLGFYRGLGYRETGTSEFTDPHRTLQPVHFIDMAKDLGAAN